MNKKTEFENGISDLTSNQQKKLLVLFSISEKASSNFPSLMRIRSNTDLAERARHPVDHPISQLCDYLTALENTCLQAIYSLSQLTYFCEEEDSASTVGNFTFYVQYYFYDFLAKVKTATDILGLMIKLIFELNLQNERCGLNNGDLATHLRNKPSSKDANEKIAKELDRVRNNWAQSFYDLRNAVVHRAGFPIISKSSDDFNPHRFYIQTIFATIDQRKPLEEFLKKINSKSISPIDGGLHITIFCDEVLALLNISIEKIIKLCESHINDFIRKNGGTGF